MIKTFNRTPISVNTPDDKNIKNYFFNHYNWKGMCDDKNILAVDQETFSDCKNVYVDSEGLLRSRPSLKIKTVTYTNAGNEYTLSDILDVWTFNDVTVYLSTSDKKYYLTFVNKNVTDNIQRELKYTDGNGETHSYSKVMPILADNKIFIFSEHDFNYYDIEKNIYATAIDFIYIPTTSVASGNKTTELDSPNVLTKSYITKYLYDKSTNINFADLVGKEITVEVDEVSYKIKFEYNNELVFVERYSGLGENNFSTTNNILGKNTENIPLVQASERESTLVCSYERVLDNKGNISSIDWTIYHTVDGITFTRVPSKSKILGMPKISRDGFYAFVFCEDGPWVYSLLDTEGKLTGTKTYPVWKNLLKTINETKYNEWIDEGFNLNKHNSVDVYFNQTISVNGYFRDDRAFAFTYGDGLVNTNGEPRYKNFYCVYCYGSDFYKKVIFNSTIDTPYTYTPRVSSTKLAISADTETSGTSGNPYYNIITSNNLTDVQFVYVNENGATTYTAYLTDLNLVLSLFSPAYPQGNGTSCSGTSILFGNYKIADNDGNVIDSGQIYNKINVSLDLMSKQGYVQNFTTSYFSFNVDVLITGDATIPSNSHIYVIPGTPGSSSGSGSYITISAGNISGTDVISGTLLEGKPAATAQSMPNLYVAFKEQRMSIAVDFTASIPNDVYYDNYRGIYRIERDNTGETRPRIIYSKLYPGSVPVVRPPLRDGLIISNGRYMFTTLEKEGEKEVVYVHTIKYDNNEFVYNHITKVFSEEYVSDLHFLNKTFVFGDPVPYLLTKNQLFTYDDYTSDAVGYDPINLLFTCFPIAYFYGGNVFDSMYIATTNALYISNADKVIELAETTVGETNFILPEVYALLENYYVGIGNKLYISKFVTDNGKFKWYFPEISVQPFDNSITNLQPISNSEVAIFFENEIWHSTFDAETVIDGKQGVYRYYKSKLQAGCKKGSDVLVTYDGKYTIFASNRGLVAMSYQDFIASTEQSLTYLSDNIYDMFINYIIEKNSLNQIKLYKFGYWIVIYKRDSKDGFVFDTRNNSWWPLSSFDKPTKFVTIDNKVEMLSAGNMYDLNKSDADYYDYDGEFVNKVSWFVKSQKLHLSALNNYKHIINMTFVSVHDSNILQNSEYNIDGLDFKLQVNCYRKKVDGNINSLDDYVTVNYRVDTIRTYVQRLNYSKINEFQYQLSSDEENAMDIPLSLNSITIKYKVGGQVR
jgi:hypothetical protein